MAVACTLSGVAASRGHAHAHVASVRGQLYLARDHGDGLCDSRRHRAGDERGISVDGATDGPHLEPGLLGLHGRHLRQRRAGGRRRDARAPHSFGRRLSRRRRRSSCSRRIPPAPVASIFDTTGTTMLYVGFFTMGLSQGLVEGVINPLVATLYSAEKTKKLNMLHAWWPGGMIIGGLLAYALATSARLADQAEPHPGPGGDLSRHGDCRVLPEDRARGVERLDR